MDTLTLAAVLVSAFLVALFGHVRFVRAGRPRIGGNGFSLR